jgi:hypothetical protein
MMRYVSPSCSLHVRVRRADDDVDRVRVALEDRGSASMTYSMPLSGERRPNVRMTRFPSTPSRCLPRGRSGRLAIPWGMRSMLRSGHAVDVAEERRRGRS